MGIEVPESPFLKIVIKSLARLRKKQIPLQKNNQKYTLKSGRKTTDKHL